MVSQSDADTSSHTIGRMRSSKARVQIVGRVSGRRNWTVEQKLAIIGEDFTSGSSVASTIERHEISSGQLYTWRRQLLDGELGGVRLDPGSGKTKTRMAGWQNPPSGSLSPPTGALNIPNRC
jgi:transposase